MKKIFSILGLLCVVFLMSACSTNTNAKLEGRLLNYDLGSGMLETTEGKSIPYEIQGVLGIPETKNAPVVVLVHGAHPIEKAAEDRYDIGLNYLAQALSEQGTFVMSVNVGMNYSFEAGEPYGNERTYQIIEQQLALLKKAIDGDKKVFDYDLSGVGDLNKVIMLGHSRGGLDVIEVASKMPAEINVIGLIAVAPSLYKTLETDIPNVPMGIIIPQMDGDVIALDGNDIYENIISDTNYTKTAELIYLKNANHGYFNTQLTAPDLSHNEEDVAKLMPAEKQREFLVKYVADFVQNVTTTGETVFSENQVLEGNVYNCDVLLRVYSGSGTQLYSAEGEEALIASPSTVVKKEIASYFPENHTLEYFKMPGGAAFKAYALEHITWEGNDGSVTIPLNADLSQKKFLDIDMAIDSTAENNKNGQAMTLRFIDEAGKSVDVEVASDSPALLWQEGEFVEYKDWDGGVFYEYSTFTPLVTLRVDLNKVSGIDLSKVKSVEMLWEDSQGGSLMLRSMRA